MKIVRIHSRDTAKAQKSFIKREMVIWANEQHNVTSLDCRLRSMAEGSEWITLKYGVDITFKPIGEYEGEAKLEEPTAGRTRRKPVSVRRASEVRTYYTESAS